MWKYNGKGFVIGIPARNLTDEEVEKMSKQDRAAVEKCGYYEHEKTKKPAKVEE